MVATSARKEKRRKLRKEGRALIPMAMPPNTSAQSLRGAGAGHGFWRSCAPTSRVGRTLLVQASSSARARNHLVRRCFLRQRPAHCRPATGPHRLLSEGIIRWKFEEEAMICATAKPPCRSTSDGVGGVCVCVCACA